MGYYAKLSALWGLSCRNVQQGAAGGGQYSPEPPACWRCRMVQAVPERAGLASWEQQAAGVKKNHGRRA